MSEDSAVKEKPFNPWHFLWISIVMAELFTAIMITIQTYYSPVIELTYALKMGAMDALLVPLIVAPVIIYFVRNEAVLKTMNARLAKEIAWRKEIEGELQTSKALLASAFDKSPLLMTISDLATGKYLEVSDGFCKVSGFRREEAVGKTSVELGWISADERELMVQALKQKRQVVGLELNLQSKGRQKIICRYAGEIVQTPNGDRLISIAEDITEKKRAEELLIRSEALLKESQKIAGIGSWELDLVRNRLAWSDEVYRIFGLEPQEFGATYEAFLDHVHPDDRAAVDAAYSGSVREGKDAYEIEHRVVRKASGAIRHVHEKCLHSRDAAGAIIRSVGTVHDITERKQLQEEMLKTQKLEALGTLAGGIAHDFNNLLQCVFGYISLAKLEKDDRKKSVAAMEEAEKALQVTVRLTNQLLTFSKGGKPVTTIIDLLPVITDSATFALSGSRVISRIVADDGLWQADADEGQIGQVIQNIVLNASQAMPDGGSVEILARNVQASGQQLPQDLKEGGYVEITISDTGIGIPEKYLHKIFDPYFTTKEKGSGLGLATSYSIIRNHRGAISVTSEPGKGTAFRIYLPAAMTAKTGGVQTPPVAVTSARKGRILVMDDEEMVLDVAGKLITKLGHEVEFARNGTEAFGKYQDARSAGKPYDIVILDVTIRGGMGGVETFKKLFEIDPAVKAVVSSGYSDDAAVATYEQQGFKRVLRKPYRLNTLQEVLHELLSS